MRSAIPAARSAALSPAQVLDHRRRLDRAVVDDRVAAVVGLGPCAQQRHQVQVGDAELAQIPEPLAHAGQRAGGLVDVGDVADRLLALASRA